MFHGSERIFPPKSYSCHPGMPPDAALKAALPSLELEGDEITVV